jgi:hypothetical protein
MRIRYIPLVSLLAASTYVYAAPGGEFVGASSNFAIDHKTEVPGLTLKPGEYSIRILDQLSDRMIVRIDSSTGKDHAIFLAVPNSSIATASGSGAVNWNSPPKGADALRGFSFATNKTVEFVYPKAEAVELAKLNAAQVLAIDPESQAMPPALKNLSKDDMQIVNLWVLALTTTGPNHKTPAILAQRYQGQKSAGSTVVANTQPAATPQPATAQSNQVASVEAPGIESQAWDSAPAVKRARPAMARLPKTASLMPLVWLVGLFSFVGALCLGLFRRLIGSVA